jgi:hypothetical protein
MSVRVTTPKTVPLTPNIFTKSNTSMDHLFLFWGYNIHIIHRRNGWIITSV